MYISRVKIQNFANFQNLDIKTNENMVIVGENKVGKSNFIRALQLILDPGLSERERYLELEHFWDGLGSEKLGKTIEISIELSDFGKDANLCAILADCLVKTTPLVARLTYKFQPKAALEGSAPKSLADYEYIIFGGKNENLSILPSQRRLIPLDILPALRDAEKDLASWRRSPIRPLIEDASLAIDDARRNEIDEAINETHTMLTGFKEITKIASDVSKRLIDIVGQHHSTSLTLGPSPVQVDHLFRNLRLLIDEGRRDISDASLGTANLIFLTLKTLELDRLICDGERNHTFFAIEEPEAHLHPHIQRLVYRYLLNGTEKNNTLTTILTTHSPHIVSVSPLQSLILLRQDSKQKKTIGTSISEADFSPSEIADLQRYIDVTRGELFFAKGIIFVEGDAERFLLPAFATALGMDLDILGISVCSVFGTNFSPYVKLASALDIPYVVLTDLDPIKDKPPLALNRVKKLLKVIDAKEKWEEKKERDVWKGGKEYGIFVNNSTLEPELFKSGLGQFIVKIFKSHFNLSSKTQEKLKTWISNTDQLDVNDLLNLIDRIGKGRFAQMLAAHVSSDNCPVYIKGALEYIRGEFSDH